MRKGLLNFFFKYSPDLIGLTMTDLETREGSLGWRNKHVDWSIEYAKDVPGGKLGNWFGERVTAGDTFFGFNDTIPPERLENFLKVILREVFSLGYRVDRKWFFSLSQSEYRSEAIVGFF